MSLPMTKIEGVPDSSDVKPGMAFFAKTGPAGTTCGDCKFRGYTRESSKGHWSEAAQDTVYRTYRVQKCLMVKKMTGHHGADVDADNHSCKFFEPKPKQ